MSSAIYFDATCPWCGSEIVINDANGDCSTCGREWRIEIVKVIHHEHENESWLRERLVNQRRSLRQVAYEAKTSHMTIKRWAQKFGIEVPA